MPLSLGDKLGPYEIVTSIGAGGMGEVYRARDPRMGREVAIKLSGEHFSDRFSREVHAIAALNHPNICHLYDVGPDYLVMELVEGSTLEQRIKQGALPLDEALRIARQIAAALEAAHDKGIVHRDLKPANWFGESAPGSSTWVNRAGSIWEPAPAGCFGLRMEQNSSVGTREKLWSVPSTAPAKFANWARGQKCSRTCLRTGRSFSP
jgi:serine/threonine protein kinase